MKKLLFIFLISILYVSCSNNQSSSTTTDSAAPSATTATSETAVTMPYTANYSSDFKLGSQSADVLTVLNSYKAWEAGDMTALGNTMADSVAYNFSDGTMFSGSRDSAVAMAKSYREDFSSIKISMDAWLPVHSNNKNEDWVLVWYKEIGTHKNGKIDSSYNHELNLVKNGKIAFAQSMTMKYKK